MAAREIKTITRPKIDTHFRNVTPDRPPVAKTSRFNEPQACRNAHLCPPITEFIQPISKFLGLAQLIHILIVSRRIR